MRYNIENLNKVLEEGVKTRVYSDYALSVGDTDGEYFRILSHNVTSRTLFDMASVTKVVSTSLIALSMINLKDLSLSDTIGDFFDAPEDKKDITIKQLMTHQAGFHTSYHWHEVDPNPNNVVKTILSRKLEYKTGTDVIYSCMGYIVLGKILEKLSGLKLSQLFKSMVVDRIGMKDACFTPSRHLDISNAQKNPALYGLVNDTNARMLSGISGNAGLFASLDDMVKYALKLCRRYEGLTSDELFEFSIQNHTPFAELSRGLGFQLVNEVSEQPGKLFCLGSYGHTGYTGTSVFVDRETNLYAVILTNRTCYGDDNVAMPNGYRAKIHDTIKECLYGA